HCTLSAGNVARMARQSASRMVKLTRASGTRAHGRAPARTARSRARGRRRGRATAAGGGAHGGPAAACRCPVGASSVLARLATRDAQARQNLRRPRAGPLEQHPRPVARQGPPPAKPPFPRLLALAYRARVPLHATRPVPLAAEGRPCRAGRVLTLPRLERVEDEPLDREEAHRCLKSSRVASLVGGTRPGSGAVLVRRGSSSHWRCRRNVAGSSTKPRRHASLVFHRSTPATMASRCRAPSAPFHARMAAGLCRFCG